VHDLFIHTKTSEAKLELQSNSATRTFFPVLERLKCNEYEPNFVECIPQLRKELDEEIKHIRSREQENLCFATIFSSS